MTMPSSFLDLRQLDMHSIVRMLRAVVLAQLSLLFRHQEPTGLSGLLGETAALLTEHGRVASHKIEFAPILSQAQASSLSESEISKKVVQHTEYLVAGNPPYRFPDLLWDLVEHWAWQDPEFAHAVAMEFHHFLERKYLMEPGGPPRVTLAPQSFWFLLALGDAGDSQNSRRYPKQIQSARQRLTERAKTRILSDGWADFWDLWLILYAKERWRATFKQLAKPMRQVFDELPPRVTPDTLPERPEPAAKPTLLIAKPNWKENMPPWMAAHFG